MKHLLSYIILISAFVLWALPNETKAQTCDVTVNVQVDFWYWEAQYAVVDASFNFVLPWQSFSSSFQSQSTVLPGLTDGGVYYVVLTDTYGDGGVSGSVTAGGALLTSWSSFSYGSAAYKVFTVDCGAAPLANDLCSGAEPIDCGQTVSGSTSAATNDFASFCGTSNTAPGVWYEFTGNGDCVELSTCGYANYDTKITVYSGSCGALSCVAGNDDDFSCTGFRSTVDFATTPGVQYYVLVHGFSSATGDFDLTMSCSSGPFYDDVCAAPNLGLGIVWGWDSDCATAQPGEVSPGPGTDGTSSCNSQDGWCSFETGVQASVWFTFTAPASGCVSIQSAFQAFPYDTQLAVWEVGDCSDFSTFTELAANDDGGFVFSSFVEQLSCLTPGAEYYIQVDGYNGTQGPGAILITDCGNDPLTASASGCGAVYEGIDIQYSCATINGSASGGFPPYTYSWSNGSTDPSITVCPTATTTYTLTVTDNNGCVTTTDWTVEVLNIFCSTGGSGSSSGAGAGYPVYPSASGSGCGSGSSSSASGASRPGSGSASPSGSSTSSSSGSSSSPFEACSLSCSGSIRSACKSSGSGSGSGSGTGSASGSSSSNGPDRVQMCFDGVTYCVKIEDVCKKIACGYTLGECCAVVGDNYVNASAADNWIGYMNVFDNPASPCCGGGYIFGSPWGVPDIATTLDAGANTIELQPNFNCYNAADPFWSDGSGNGNKIMNANTYVEPGAAFNGVDITFSGSVASHTLDLSQYTAKYFIKALNPAAGFSDALGGSATFDLPLSGDFSVTVPGSSLPAGLIIQYGFQVDGFNANPANAAALGSVVVTGATIEPCLPGQNSAACDNTISTVPVASDCECNGKVASITVRYVGADGQDFNVNSKKCKGLIAAFTGANTGDEFTINASDGGLSYFKNFTYFELVGSGYGSIKIPTNCHCNAQGQRFYPFEVVSWTDTDGNSCPDVPPCEDLNVTITLDNYPSETSFQLENTTTGTILLDVPG
ncbi:MAG: hypothetical protein CL833_10790, partial [Crocinitomicaceae bacterium]|nr:hypothetical protein [Crocinitomicaceae bacterium]